MSEEVDLPSLLARGEHGRVVRLLDDALELPGLVNENALRLNRAYCHEEIGLYRKALKDYEAVVASDAEDARALAGKARVLRALGQEARAHEALSKLFESASLETPFGILARACEDRDGTGSGDAAAADRQGGIPAAEAISGATNGGLVARGGKPGTLVGVGEPRGEPGRGASGGSPSVAEARQRRVPPEGGLSGGFFPRAPAKASLPANPRSSASSGITSIEQLPPVGTWAPRPPPDALGSRRGGRPEASFASTATLRFHVQAAVDLVNSGKLAEAVRLLDAVLGSSGGPEDGAAPGGPAPPAGAREAGDAAGAAPGGPATAAAAAAEAAPPTGLEPPGGGPPGAEIAAALTTRGTAKALLGDLVGAEADLSAAIAREPAAADSRSRRAQARLALGDPEGAKADMRSAVELYGGAGVEAAVVLADLARALSNEGSFKEGAEVAVEALEAAGDARAARRALAAEERWGTSGSLRLGGGGAGGEAGKAGASGEAGGASPTPPPEPADGDWSTDVGSSTWTSDLASATSAPGYPSGSGTRARARASALRTLATVLTASGRLAAGLAAFRSARRLSPLDAGLAVLHASAAKEAGDRLLAKEAAYEALRIAGRPADDGEAASPPPYETRWSAHRVLASLAAGLGDPVAAVRQLDRALEAIASEAERRSGAVGGGERGGGLAGRLERAGPSAAGATAETLSLRPPKDGDLSVRPSSGGDLSVHTPSRSDSLVTAAGSVQGPSASLMAAGDPPLKATGPDDPLAFAVGEAGGEPDRARAARRGLPTSLLADWADLSLLRAQCLHTAGLLQAAAEAYSSVLAVAGADATEESAPSICLSFYLREVAVASAWTLDRPASASCLDSSLAPDLKVLWCRKALPPPGFVESYGSRMQPRPSGWEGHDAPPGDGSAPAAAAARGLAPAPLTNGSDPLRSPSASDGAVLPGHGGLVDRLAASAAVAGLLAVADDIGSRLQYEQMGFLPNRRARRAAGLATLEAAQLLAALAAALPAPGPQIPDSGSSAGAARRSAELLTSPPRPPASNGPVPSCPPRPSHAPTWRDLADVAVRWRRLADPADQVLWVDALSAEEFSRGFGSHTPMVTGRTATVRYASQAPAAARALRQLVADRGRVWVAEEEEAPLDGAALGALLGAETAEELWDAVGKDYWATLRFPKPSVPRSARDEGEAPPEWKTLEGARLTVAKLPPRAAAAASAVAGAVAAAGPVPDADGGPASREGPGAASAPWATRGVAAEATDPVGSAPSRLASVSRPPPTPSVEFSIRTPVTPSRWAAYDAEISLAFARLVAALEAGGGADAEEAALSLSHLFFNFMPLARGSAFCGSVLAFAGLAACGRVPAAPPPGRQTDWEALLSGSFQAFRAATSAWLGPGVGTTLDLTALPAVPDLLPTPRHRLAALNIPYPRGTGLEG